VASHQDGSHADVGVGGGVERLQAHGRRQGYRCVSTLYTGTWLEVCERCRLVEAVAAYIMWVRSRWLGWEGRALVL
jgi:hypothetical protein